MTITNSKLAIRLDDLLRQRTVESERIEYKAGWNPDAIVRTLCAFANDFENLGGGYVVIGQDCDADGRPIFPPAGVPEAQIDKIQRELLAHCQLIQPPYFPVLSLEVVQRRTLIVLHAPGGQSRPYKAPEAVTASKKTWRYYIRRYSSTVEAKGDTEQELLSLAAKVPFDDRFNPLARVADLSRPLMQDFLREVGSALAADAPALSTEALVNAVYHRSYEEREPIEVRISHDELVIVSYPGPDRSIRMRDLRAGHAVSRRYRNRRIGEFLKELEMTEGRSTGIPKILRAMAANGSPAPLFETDDERLSFVIRLPRHPLALVPTGEVTPEVTPEVGRLLAVLQGEMSRQHLMAALGLKDEKHFRVRYQQAAIAAGLVEMSLPATPRSSRQRYRLTPAGRQWLKAHANGSSV
ncbi:MAG: ATP-binding protein [Comamonadaceae bacterium]|nr:ATP-binding protein [Comamonadaceae bacterium]